MRCGQPLGEDARMTGSSDDRKSLRNGHRQRMRQRLRAHGADNLREDEVLEMLLFHVIHRGDVKELAKDMIRTFGSLERVIFADEESLLAVPNVGEQTVILFKLMQKLGSEFMRNDIVENKKSARTRRRCLSSFISMPRIA